MKKIVMSVVLILSIQTHAQMAEMMSEPHRPQRSLSNGDQDRRDRDISEKSQCKKQDRKLAKLEKDLKESEETIDKLTEALLQLKARQNSLSIQGGSISNFAANNWGVNNSMDGNNIMGGNIMSLWMLQQQMMQSQMMRMQYPVNLYTNSSTGNYMGSGYSTYSGGSISGGR